MQAVVARCSAADRGGIGRQRVGVNRWRAIGRRFVRLGGLGFVAEGDGADDGDAEGAGFGGVEIGEGEEFGLGGLGIEGLRLLGILLAQRGFGQLSGFFAEFVVF